MCRLSVKTNLGFRVTYSDKNPPTSKLFRDLIAGEHVSVSPIKKTPVVLERAAHVSAECQIGGTQEQIRRETVWEKGRSNSHGWRGHKPRTWRDCAKVVFR
jgi:hypothetical protein